MRSTKSCFVVNVRLSRNAVHKKNALLSREAGAPIKLPETTKLCATAYACAYRETLFFKKAATKMVVIINHTVRGEATMYVARLGKMRAEKNERIENKASSR